MFCGLEWSFWHEENLGQSFLCCSIISFLSFPSLLQHWPGESIISLHHSHDLSLFLALQSFPSHLRNKSSQWIEAIIGARSTIKYKSRGRRRKPERGGDRERQRRQKKRKIVLWHTWKMKIIAFFFFLPIFHTSPPLFISSCANTRILENIRHLHTNSNKYYPVSASEALQGLDTSRKGFI